MSFKSIIAMPVLLFAAAAAQAAEQTRQTTVVQDMATGAGAQPGTYAGTHILYQDVAIPSAAGGVADGTSNTLMVGEKIPGATKPTSASGPQRYADVPPGSFADPPAAGAKIKNPTGGTKLPAVQKARGAANRTPQSDKHRGEIEIQSWSVGGSGQAAPHSGGMNVLMGDGSVRNHAPKDGSCVAGCSNNLTPGDGQQRGQTPHVGGMLVGLGDGSVRNGVSPVGGNETISIGSGSTETKPGSGADSVWMDLGTPVGRAAGDGGQSPGGAPKGGSLGSLQGMGSIGQLAAPRGTGDAAGGQVRNRMFSIVDRTPTAKDGANTGAVGGNKTQNIGIGRTETTAGGGPNVKVFSGNDGAGARGASSITTKGQAIKQN